MSAGKLTLGAVLYPGFEMLDLFGPLEMFSLMGSEQIEIVMISESGEPVRAAMAENLEAGPGPATGTGLFPSSRKSPGTAIHRTDGPQGPNVTLSGSNRPPAARPRFDEFD